MFIEQQDAAPAIQPPSSKAALWFRLLLSLLLGSVALWFIVRDVSWSELRLTLAGARISYILFGLLIIFVTILIKTWRWQLLFRPFEQPPPLRALYSALVLGQFTNALLPLRLGEFVRIFVLHQQAGSGKALILGTLVVEKTLEILVLAVTVVILLPIMVMPRFVSEPGLTLAPVALIAALSIYLLAFHTSFVVGVLAKIARHLPAPLEQRLMHLALSGLQGLSAVRQPRLVLILVVTSALLGILSVLTPLVLFPALGLPLGWREAVLLNLVLSVATSPPSTPAKLGVFEWLVALMLRSFGLTEGVLILSYAVIFHLVVIIPQIVLGALAMWRTGSKTLPLPL